MQKLHAAMIFKTEAHISIVKIVKDRLYVKQWLYQLKTLQLFYTKWFQIYH